MKNKQYNKRLKKLKMLCPYKMYKNKKCKINHCYFFTGLEIGCHLANIDVLPKKLFKNEVNYD